MPNLDKSIPFTITDDFNRLYTEEWVLGSPVSSSPTTLPYTVTNNDGLAWTLDFSTLPTGARIFTRLADTIASLSALQLTVLIQTDSIGDDRTRNSSFSIITDAVIGTWGPGFGVSPSDGNLYDLGDISQYLDTVTGLLTIPFTLIDAGIQPFVWRSDWNQEIGMILAPTEFGAFFYEVSTISVTGQYVPFHTGAMGDPTRRARAVHDHRTGQPYLSDEAVSDGWTENLMLHPDNYDPRDHVPDYVVPASEGIVDDQVTDVEDS